MGYRYIEKQGYYEKGYTKTSIAKNWIEFNYLNKSVISKFILKIQTFSFTYKLHQGINASILEVLNMFFQALWLL